MRCQETGDNADFVIPLPHAARPECFLHGLDGMRLLIKSQADGSQKLEKPLVSPQTLALARIMHYA